MTQDTPDAPKSVGFKIRRMEVRASAQPQQLANPLDEMRAIKANGFDPVTLLSATADALEARLLPKADPDPHAYNPMCDDLSTVRSDAPMSLYTLAMGESVWPANKRTIYCAVTGKPWGMVTDEYVQEVVAAFDGTADQLQVIIDRMTLFSGPSPLWQSKVPGMLQKNKQVDPAGFLVYLLNSELLRKVYDEARKGNLDFDIQWRKSQVALYKALRKLDPVFVANVCDTLLMLSGEGLLPSVVQLKGRTLGDYETRKSLEDLVALCRDRYKRHWKNRNRRTFANQPVGNSVHQRTATADNSLDKLNDKMKDRAYELILESLFDNIDLSYDAKQRKRAESIIGVASPIRLELAKLDALQKNVRKTTGRDIPSVINPAPFKQVVPGTFSIGRKKEPTND